MISFRKRFLKLFSVMYSEERGTTKLAQIKEQEIFVNPYVVQMDKFADSLQHFIQKHFMEMPEWLLLMIIGSVPLYNMMAVVILSVFKPGQSGLDRTVVKKTLKGIVTNPILIGIVAGLVWSALKIPMPAIPKKVISSIGNVATPMGLMAMGATFDIKKAFGKIKPSAIAAFMKLIGLCAIFLPIAVKLGFRTDKLVAILIMLGSATTVSSFVMAKNMGHEGTLSSSVVMLTTMFSAFTVTGWLYILRHFMLI